MHTFTGAGKVWLEGEAWQAFSKQPVSKGQDVVVRDLEGLVLHVEPVADVGTSGMQTE
jgi:membrane-bound serine protease (ClpP class)